MAEPLIVVDKVTKRYGAETVLSGVDLAVEVGQVLVVIGPSGSGKSTLLRCLARLEPIQRGRILIDGKLVSKGAEDPGPPPEAATLRGAAQRHRHGVPELQPVPASDGDREHHPGAAPRAGHDGGRSGGAGHRAAAAGRPRGQARRLSVAPLGRPAAARRDRPRARHAPARHAVRRGDLGARPRAGRRGAEDHARPGRAEA